MSLLDTQALRDATPGCQSGIVHFNHACASLPSQATLPDWHESSWTVRGRMHFLHVYFLPEHFTRRAVLELDREPREVTLADRTYFEHERIGRLCAGLAAMSWEGPDARLRVNETVHETLSHLLLSQSMQRHQQRVRGGLAPAVRRRLAEYIEAHLAHSISLGTLAQLACMSEYHLARMFRVSFGMPPSAWIAQRRVEHARRLLKTTNHPLQQIADACGYADLSHFSHRFRDSVGAPPTSDISPPSSGKRYISQHGS